MRKNNKKRIFKLILVGIILIFSSCNENSSNKDFFLGGEIINPSSKYVNFYYNNIKIDSISSCLYYTFAISIFNGEKYLNYINNGQCVKRRLNILNNNQRII